MKLLISIEYRTRWGEQLVMRIGKRRIALQYADVDIRQSCLLWKDCLWQKNTRKGKRYKK